MAVENRDNWIDWAKAIGIFLVVWGHIPLNNESSMVTAFIYSFHMPLFFFISGYLFKIIPSFKQETQKGFKALIIPYLIYQLLIYPYWLTKELITSDSGFQVYNLIVSPVIQSLLANPINGATWFVVCLFFMKLTANLILRRKQALLYIAISCTFAISLYWYLNSQNLLRVNVTDRFLSLLLFFFLGYICKQKNMITYMINKPKTNCMLLLTSVIITLIINSISYQVSCTSFYDIAMFYTVGISGSLMVISIGIFLNHVKSHIIYQLSIGTLVILGTHCMFIGIINFAFEKYLHIPNVSYSSSVSLAIALSIMAITYPVILFCKKYCPILLGKSSLKTIQ